MWFAAIVLIYYLHQAWRDYLSVRYQRYPNTDGSAISPTQTPASEVKKVEMGFCREHTK